MSGPWFRVGGALLLTLSPALWADDGAPPVRTALIPGTTKTVVVAEGQLEPRSTGSYSLRVYAGSNPRFPYDRFLAGVVRARDGSVVDVRFSDLERAGEPDIVVIIRSAGTGGYISADAFRLDTGVLSLIGAVSGLPATEDPVLALKARIEGAAK